HDLGHMNIPCLHCNALHWIDERSSPSAPKTTSSLSQCCMDGKIISCPSTSARTSPLPFNIERTC
ncbi:hypothetical protein BDN70DRAFT_821150, partial [Pholiota conissans]